MSEADNKLISAGQTRAIVDEIMKAPTSPHLRKPTPQEAQEIAIVEKMAGGILAAIHGQPWHLVLLALRRATHHTITTDVPRGTRRKAFEFFVTQLTLHLGKREL